MFSFSYIKKENSKKEIIPLKKFSENFSNSSPNQLTNFLKYDII